NRIRRPEAGDDDALRRLALAGGQELRDSKLGFRRAKKCAGNLRLQTRWRRHSFSLVSGAPSPKTTPLFHEHVKLGAKMVEFGGWHMPVQYSGIIDEHHAV